jgi:hypothetical protein
MKKLLAFAVLLISGLGFAQSTNINDYKYVIVPEKFDFLKEPNKYNLNQLTKMIFEKQGFQVFYPNDKMPDELALNKCKALYGDLVDDSGMLTTAVMIVIKDCGGKELYRSERGSSKQKDFQKGYYESLREASASLQQNLNYQYSGDSAAQEPAQVISQPAQPQQQQPQAPTPAVAATPVVSQATLFAQPIANGYQLVDTTPKVVLKMYKTTQPDSYTAVGDGKNGVVFKKGNEWFFEYYKDDKLISEKLDIKF